MTPEHRTDAVPRWALPTLLGGIAALMMLTAHVDLDPRAGRLQRWQPTVERGDEPHYQLVMTSLLFDGDADLTDDYRRVRRGSADAGRLFRGYNLDHHSILVDVRTGEGVRWYELFDRHRPIACAAEAYDCHAPRSTAGYSRSASTRELSSHPMAYPALLALLVAPFAADALQAELAAGYVNLLLGWLGLLAMVPLCRRAGLDARQTLWAIGLTGVASPWLAYGNMRFAEVMIGGGLVLGLWAMRGRRPLLAAAGVAVAAAAKAPFALVGVAWLGERARAGRLREVLVLGAGLAALGLPLMLLNYLQVGSILVPGQQGWKGIEAPHQALLTLLQPRQGLLFCVPWTAFAGLELYRVLRRARGGDDALGLQIALPVLALLPLFMAFDGQGGALGPRYWVPLLPWLAMLAARTLPGLDRAGRLLFVGSAALGALAAIGAALMHVEAWDMGPHGPVLALFRALSG